MRNEMATTFVRLMAAAFILSPVVVRAAPPPTELSGATWHGSAEVDNKLFPVSLWLPKAHPMDKRTKSGDLFLKWGGDRACDIQLEYLDLKDVELRAGKKNEKAHVFLGGVPSGGACEELRGKKIAVGRPRANTIWYHVVGAAEEAELTKK